MLPHHSNVIRRATEISATGQWLVNLEVPPVDVKWWTLLSLFLVSIVIFNRILGKIILGL